MLRARNKKVHGVGVNDADYSVSKDVDGKRVLCPFYFRWKDMLSRCYGRSSLSRFPTYRDVTVCDEWLLFSNFKRWMEAQDWKGKELDKDFVIFGSKVYSPETCVFIDKSLNVLFSKPGVGVKKEKSGRYSAKCVSGKKTTYKGGFENIEDAMAFYRKLKISAILRVAITQSDNRVFRTLIGRAASI